MSWLSDPAIGGITVTPSDSTNILGSASGVVRGIYVGGTGDVALVWKSGNTTTLVAVPAGTTLAAQVVRVNSTGTTATNLVAFI